MCSLEFKGSDLGNLIREPEPKPSERQHSCGEDSEGQIILDSSGSDSFVSPSLIRLRCGVVQADQSRSLSHRASHARGPSPTVIRARSRPTSLELAPAEEPYPM